MRVLITGASGFIGRHLAKRLEEEADTELFLLDRAAADVKPAPPSPDTILSQSSMLHADLRVFEEVQNAIDYP